MPRPNMARGSKVEPMVPPGGASLNPQSAEIWRGGSKVECMVGVTGALSNPALTPDLRQLQRIVERARTVRQNKRASPLPVARPGWAAQLATEILRDAGEPMRAIEIRQEAERRLGRPIHKDTWYYVLRRSRPARDGRIVKTKDGQYVARTVSKDEIG